MGSPERARSSSSASADIATGSFAIVSIEAGTPAGVMQVTLADGSRFFILKQLLEQHAGDLGDASARRAALFDRLAELQLLSHQTLARRKAIDLLARREYSRAELEQRLAQRGYEREAVQPVLDELARRGYQSDHRYAVAYIASRLRRRPQARRQLLLELKAKGVETVTAEAALREYARDNPNWEDAALEEAARRALRGRRVTREGVAARLTRLGFSVAAAQRAARRVLPQDDTAADES